MIDKLLHPLTEKLIRHILARHRTKVVNYVATNIWWMDEVSRDVAMHKLSIALDMAIKGLQYACTSASGNSSSRCAEQDMVWCFVSCTTATDTS